MSTPTPATSSELPPFTRYIRLESIDPTKNRARFYLLQWQPTLDGRLALLRIWGRLGTLGRVRTLLWADDAQMPDHIERVLHQRLRHGYQLVAWQ
jgi:predicted DNA-binding WGR domain protein